MKQKVILTAKGSQLAQIDGKTFMLTAAQLEKGNFDYHLENSEWYEETYNDKVYVKVRSGEVIEVEDFTFKGKVKLGTKEAVLPKIKQLFKFEQL